MQIPAANLLRTTMANSQEVYLGDSNDDRQPEMEAETGNFISLKLCEVQLKFQRQI